MSPNMRRSKDERRRFPRVSGDEPDLDRIGLQLTEFSPRERG